MTFNEIKNNMLLSLWDNYIYIVDKQDNHIIVHDIESKFEQIKINYEISKIIWDNKDFVYMHYEETHYFKKVVERIFNLK